MNTVYVRNLCTRDIIPYTCEPEKAVMAAYAQAKRDFSTWQYAERYGNLLLEGKFTVSCGDFVAYKDAEGPHNQQIGEQYERDLVFALAMQMQQARQKEARRAVRHRVG
jgi:hypothetical protein